MTAPLFHVSPRCNRASILIHGLDHVRGESVYRDTGVYWEFQPGNYLFTDKGAALAYLDIREREEADEYGSDAEPYDLWAINASPGDLSRDEQGNSHPLGEFAVMTTEPIPAAHLTLA